MQRKVGEAKQEDENETEEFVAYQSHSAMYYAQVPHPRVDHMPSFLPTLRVQALRS